MTEENRLIAGRYRLRRQIGSGGMGVVWEAFDEHLGRIVALKHLVLPAGLSADQTQQARQRAVREGRIAARLQHPGAVTVYDATEDDGRPVLVMEYVPARSLAEIIRDHGKLSPQHAAAIGAQVAGALAAAHAVGIVHRDVKPANILIDGGGVAKITDFGIARARGDVTVTSTGLLVGTPAFMSPEVARGHEPDPPSDVFALGATLYAALEGRGPYGDGDNAIAVLHAAAAGRIAPPAQAGPVTDVVLDMTRFDPAARPTMAQLADRLRAAAAGRPAPAPTRLDLRPLTDAPSTTALGAAAVPTGQPPRRSPSGRTAAVVLAGLAGLALVVLVAALLNNPGRPGQRAAPSAPAPSTPVPSSSPPPDTPTVSSAQLLRAVAEYYALLPDDPGTAWTRLGPGMQAQGQQQYLKAWKDVKDLTISAPPEAGGPNTVTVGIAYTMESRGRFLETHQLGLIPQGGTLLINSDQVLSSQRINGNGGGKKHGGGN